LNAAAMTSAEALGSNGSVAGGAVVVVEDRVVDESVLVSDLSPTALVLEAGVSGVRTRKDEGRRGSAIMIISRRWTGFVIRGAVEVTIRPNWKALSMGGHLRGIEWLRVTTGQDVRQRRGYLGGLLRSSAVSMEDALQYCAYPRVTRNAE